MMCFLTASLNGRCRRNFDRVNKPRLAEIRLPGPLPLLTLTGSLRRGTLTFWRLYGINVKRHDDNANEIYSIVKAADHERGRGMGATPRNVYCNSPLFRGTVYSRTYLLDFVKAECMIEAGSIHLLAVYQQWPLVATPDIHAFAQEPHGRIVLLFFPHLCEWFAVLQLKIEIFGKPAYQVRLMHVEISVLSYPLNASKARHIQVPVPLLPPGSKSTSIQTVA